MQAAPSHRKSHGPARVAALAALSLTLSACASDNYPSLDQRPAEREVTRESGSFAPATPESVAPVAAAPAFADLDQRLAALVTSAKTAHAAFLAAQPGAAERVAAAKDAAPASEPWAAATEAVSALAATRAPTVVALTTLERLHADDTLDHALADGASITPRPEAQAIVAARDEVAAIAAGEQAELGTLNAGLRD